MKASPPVVGTSAQRLPRRPISHRGLITLGQQICVERVSRDIDVSEMSIEDTRRCSRTTQGKINKVLPPAALDSGAISGLTIVVYARPSCCNIAI
jgi:hypothetical protein